MSGVAVQRTIYQPFGKKITVDEDGKVVNREDSYTNRGYTGHEHIDETSNLIHMNGRIYDSEIGRFISADPHIQAPNDTQSYNRYSYVKNNPLKYTDPSGYFFSGLKKWVSKHWKSIVTTVATVAVGFLTGGAGVAGLIIKGAAIGFTAGAVGTLVNGGSIGGALKNGIIGGIFGAVGAGLTYGVAEVFGHGSGMLGTKALAHGAVSSFMTRARGGKWNSGFWAGFAGTMLSPVTNMARGYYAKVASNAIVAGTVSAISGGKFANGAFSGAFRFMFNEWAHRFDAIIKFGNIDIAKNMAEARALGVKGVLKFKDLVKTDGKWDYKSKLQAGVNDGLFTSNLLQEFGNYHFGIVAHEIGFSLEQSMAGAGAYQVFFQEGGDSISLLPAMILGTFSFVIPNSYSSYVTYQGFSWGDNAGDAIDIMQGWKYADGL